MTPRMFLETLQNCRVFVVYSDNVGLNVEGNRIFQCCAVDVAHDRSHVFDRRAIRNGINNQFFILL